MRCVPCLPCSDKTTEIGMVFPLDFAALLAYHVATVNLSGKYSETISATNVQSSMNKLFDKTSTAPANPADAYRVDLR